MNNTGTLRVASGEGTKAGIFGLSYLLLAGIGMVSNGATAVTFHRHKEFSSAPYYWMKAVAVNDFNMMIVLGLYSGIHLIGESGWTGGIVIQCIIGIMQQAGWYLFLVHFTCLDINRFLVICLHHGHWLAVKAQNKKLTLILIVATSLAVCIFGIATVLPWAFSDQGLSAVFVDVGYGFAWDSVTLYGDVGHRIDRVVHTSIFAIQVVTQVAMVLKVIKTRNTAVAPSNPTSADQNYQIRLFIQCLGPNIYTIMFTITIWVLEPVFVYMSPWHFGLIQIIWIGNHMCNPLFYAIYNKELQIHWFSCFKDQAQHHFTRHQQTTRQRIKARGHSGQAWAESRV